MAVLAGIGGIDMPRVFPGGFGPVVTAHARPRYATMVKCRGRPTPRGMALITIVGAANMIRGFPGRDDAIMTTHAPSHDSPMVDIRHHTHTGRIMTVGALIRGVDVVLRFWGGRDKTTLLMAIDALVGGPFENTFLVALFATQFFVSPRERKPRRKVIKFRRRLLGAGHRARTHRQ